MEQGYELRLIDIRKAALEQSQNAELYIPLHGKHTTNPDEEPFDLAEKIQSFFVFNESSTNDPKVMLLMGDTGSGKSVFSQQLYRQLCKNYQTGNPIPLWIPLPELQNPFEAAVEEVLSKYKFDDGKIAEIKEKERFIFVVDGYDELHQFQNCYVTNKWEKWNAKILITCRSQALYYEKDPDKYFMPFNGERRLPLLLRKLYVAAFSEEQIGSYVKQYQQLNTEHKISEEDFTKVPGLTELIKTPFLLDLAVEALPDILASQVDDEKITQAKLYDVFIERWFSRQVKKLSAAGILKDTEQNTKQQFWDYCKKLAQQMHAKEISVIPYQGQKGGGRLFGKPAQNSLWDSFFNEETEIVRSACPLRRYGEHHYGFVHASMVEYFATRAMYEEIQNNRHTEDEQYLEEKGKKDVDNRIKSVCDTNQPRAGIHQRLFSLERQSIQFLADRIEMSEAFKQKMLLILEASKKSQHFAIGAANAITALVRAGLTFNRRILSGIKISGADISGGYFDQADLSATDLSNTQMRNVWLREANLDGSQVEGINFGEYPWFMQDKSVTCFDYREDHQRVISGSGEDLILWDTATGERLNKFKGHSKGVTCIQFSPNGIRVVSGSYDNTVRIWEVATGAEIAELNGHQNFVNSVAFSPNGENIVSASEDGTVRIWDVVKAEQIHKLIGHEGPVKIVRFSPNGDWLVSVSWDMTIRSWNVANGNMTVLMRNDGMSMIDKSIQLSIDGGRMALENDDYGINTIDIWDVASRKINITLRHDQQRGNCPISSVAFSPAGDRVVSGDNDGTVRVWDLSQKVWFVLRGHDYRVWNLQFTSDGKRVISGSEDRTLRVWDVGGEPFLSRVRGHEKNINSIQFSQDGRLMVSGSKDSTVRIWEMGSGKERVLSQVAKSWVSCAQFSPDGNLIVSGCSDGIVRLWDVESGRMVRDLHGHKSCLNSVVFSPDGKRVVSGGGSRFDTDFSIRLWEVGSGKEIMLLQGHEKVVLDVAFSHDGDRVFSGSGDNTLRVWEVSSGRELARWHCEGSVSSVCFSSNNDLAAYFDSKSRSMRIVDMVNGKTISEMPVAGNADCVQFIGDTQHIIMSNAKTIQIWSFANRRLIITWNFHSWVSGFSYHHNGSLIVFFKDLSIACWQKTDDINNNSLELRWSTNIDSPNLYVEGLRACHVIGLSDQNRRILEQRGAIIDAKNSNALVPLIVQRAGSPIHHQPRASDSQQEGEVLKEYSDPQQDIGEVEVSNNSEDDKNGCRCCVIV